MGRGRGVWWWTSWIMTHINLYHHITHTLCRKICHRKNITLRKYLVECSTCCRDPITLVCQHFDISSQINLKWLLLRCTKLYWRVWTRPNLPELLRLQEIRHQTQTAATRINSSQLTLSVPQWAGHYLIGKWISGVTRPITHQVHPHTGSFKLLETVFWSPGVFTRATSRRGWVEQALYGDW